MQTLARTRIPTAISNIELALRPGPTLEICSVRLNSEPGVNTIPWCRRGRGFGPAAGPRGAKRKAPKKGKASVGARSALEASGKVRFAPLSAPRVHACTRSHDAAVPAWNQSDVEFQSDHGARQPRAYSRVRHAHNAFRKFWFATAITRATHARRLRR